MSVPPQPSDRANISPRLEQRCTVVAYGLPRYQRGPFGEWNAGVSDGRQQRHTPEAVLRIHRALGFVLKTQTEERASALNSVTNSCGSEEISSVPLTSGANCASVLKLVL